MIGRARPGQITRLVHSRVNGVLRVSPQVNAQELTAACWQEIERLAAASNAPLRRRDVSSALTRAVAGELMRSGHVNLID